MCERRALAELDGLGDAGRGEWREWSGVAFHVRRRLSAVEELDVGPAVDIRGTREATSRALDLGFRLLHAVPEHVIAAELGGPPR
jgi:hypothetical protein